MDTKKQILLERLKELGANQEQLDDAAEAYELLTGGEHVSSYYCAGVVDGIVNGFHLKG